MSYFTTIRRAIRRVAILAVLAVVVHAAPAAANTYNVSNTNDSGAGSLRQAILDANGHAGADTIWFFIGSGAKTISLASQLPDITDGVLLDGWIQPGFAGLPLIRIDGNLIAGNSTALRIYAGTTTLRGLIFTRFGTAVIVGGGDGITFRGCYFGTTGGESGLGNANGLRLYQGTNIKLGGTASGDGNVISGNTSNGIYADPTAVGVTLQGNFIGTNAAGTAALPNGSVGVRSFALNVTVGGALAGARNLFSGNGSSGLTIESGSTGVVVRGNYFGLDAGGTVDLGNAGSGLSDSGTGTIIGGTGAGEGNVFSGNGSYGIVLDGQGTSVLGNRIGTNAAGTAALGNGSVGIRSFASNLTVGGATAAARNLISGNGNDGLVIESGSTDVIVRGNYFGLDVTGTLDFGNAGTGLSDSGTGTIIGGINAGEGNVASGNGYFGIGVSGLDTTVLGNRIGTNAAGTAAVGNGTGGIAVAGVNVTIGGTTAAARNLISGNIGGAMGIDGEADGVYVYGNWMGTSVTGTTGLGNQGGGIGTYGNNVSIGGTVNGSGNVISGNGDVGIYIGGGSNLAIRRNYIGTDATGLLPLGNGSYAIRADGAPGTQIGTPGNGNVMSNNGRGIVLGYDASGYLVRGNIIGMNKDATQPMGNGESGLEINTADNVIGGTALGAFNQIGDSTYYGIFIWGAGATNNRIEGNYIGTNVALAQGLGNWFGIVIYGANDNSIGGTVNGTGNFISDNINDGIYDWYGSRNSYLRNSVFRNGGVGIENLGRGPLPNDALDLDHGPNEGQNFPIVTTATAGGGSVTVAGFLASQPSTQFRVEYFVSTQCEASGFGEGEHYVGFQDVTSGADGKAVLGTVLTTAYVSGFVTATATDPDGNTSEFSPCAAIGAPGPGEFNISSDPILAYEDTGLVQIVVTRSLGFSGAVSVRLKTSDGTATAPGDYGVVDKILTFADGEAIRTVTLPIVLDDTAEGTQQFHVDLSEATGGAFLGGQASATVFLFDHDPLYPVYTVDDIGIAPPTSGQKIVSVPVRLSAPTDHPVTIDYLTEDGTAHAGADYIAKSGQFVFAAGEKVKLVPVTITAIGPLVDDRVFYLRIAGSGAEKVIAGDSEGEIVIFGGDRIFANDFD